ncbi:ATP-binding protein [Rhodoplanes azumiensis]|uniref:histidine kinase n=1 Tax=Rhodoplanes azumiensis TaxID=1897628 RepID=A0ABW5AIQ5_9BRAD
MRPALGRLFPLSIGTQIAGLVVVSLLGIHGLLTLLLFFGDRDDGRAREDMAAQLVALVRLAEADPDGRDALIARAATAFPQFGLARGEVMPPVPGRIAPSPGLAPPPGRPPPEPWGLDRELRALPAGVTASAIAPAEPGAPRRITVRLSDGTALAATVPPRWRPPFGPLQVTIVILASLVTVLSGWAALALTRPLRAFASAAEAFRPDGEIVPLAERGPQEIQVAARALNGMRARIKAMVEERSQMLAAVGHDLRTPITRLRLRSEFIEDDVLRAQALADLDQMRGMVESLLVFMRSGQSARAPVMVDLTASLTTVCDQFADLGHAVTYSGPDHAVILGHPDELQRAVTNLVDNAVRYAGRATVRLSLAADRVAIDVEDDGPGLPDAQKSAMLRPFARGESARSMDGTTGFGLGLSIAQVVAAAHGGSLALLDASPHGLLARITLPGDVIVRARADGPNGGSATASEDDRTPAEGPPEPSSVQVVRA